MRRTNPGRFNDVVTNEAAGVAKESKGLPVTEYLSQLQAVLAETPAAQLRAVEEELWATYLRDGTILLCGNGGSAASASHAACDLAKWTIAPGQRRVRAAALTDNLPVFSAWGNDVSYESVFVEQARNIYRAGDTLLAISGSGNSPNILRVVEWAKENGVRTIGFSGMGGGGLAKRADVNLVVPSKLMPLIEDVHMAVCHALAVRIGERIKSL